MIFINLEENMHLFIRKIANLSGLFLLILAADMDAYELPKGARRIPEYVISPEEIYVDDISAKFAEEMRKEFEIVPTGFGGCMPEKIDEIAVQFHFDKQVTIDEARWLVITLKQKLADLVNNHEKIRPFLAEYPFPSSRADISISFQRNSDMKVKNIEFIHVGRNKIYYCKDNPEKGNFDHLLIEPYEDALTIYNASEKPRIFKKVI